MDATAQSAPLDSFLAPSAVAVIGASPDTGRIRGVLLQSLRANGYRGAIHPINPNHREIDGLPCFPDVGAVGRPIDLALVAVPAPRVLAALEDCARAGVRHAAIISSGFAEAGGGREATQAEIAALARRTGMRVCGPNTEGFHNEIARVSATFSPAVAPRPDAADAPLLASSRRIGVVAQSGGIGFALYNRGRALGLRFSQVVTTGNEADLTAADFLDHMAGSADTDAILLFLESVRDPARFVAAASRAARAGKPVVAIKAGRSRAGRRAAASHTASLAGWDGAYEAAFRTHGIIPARDPDEAMAILAALTTCPAPRGDRVGIVTVSGGAGAWVADTLAGAGLRVPVLGAAAQDRMRAFIPFYGSAANPVDITAQGARGGGTVRAVEILMADEDIDLIVVVTSLANEAHVSIDPAALGPILASGRKPVLFFSYTLASAFARRSLAGAGAVALTGLAALGDAAGALVRQARFRPRARPAPPGLPPEPRRRLADAPTGQMPEHAAKSLLAACGIEIAPFRLAAHAGELDAAAAALGFPLALKIQSRDIPHKTEIGGVRLGIADAAGLRAAHAEVLDAASRAVPDARIDGVLIERMAPRGVEIIVGVLRDETFGPVLTVGLGGITAELFADATFRTAPVDEDEALEMLRELRGFPLLDGFRGAPPADTGALARLIARVSAVAAAADTVREIELNPVIVHSAGAGCTIADALLVAGAAPGEG